MSPEFIGCDRETPYLLPPSVLEWLPEKHLARFVVEIVDHLNLQSLKDSYTGRGSQPYNPEMLIALLFYGYATGVFSSRHLERSTYDSIAFRYIAANTHPDHDTIATFRKRFLPHLTALFIEILKIGHELGVLKLGTVSLDGSKVKANASKHKALSYGYASKLEAQIETEVAELLSKAEAADKADIPDGMEIPEELSRRTERLKAIKEAKAEIERRASERHAAEQKAYEETCTKRAQKEQETGKKPRGKEPKPPQAGPNDKDQVNFTDGESRIMPVSGGGFEQAYNAQAGVDTESLLVVAAHISQNPNDKQELKPVLDALGQLPEELGAVTKIIADNGYYSEDNVRLCDGKEIIPYISVGREKHNPPLWERLQEPPPLTEKAGILERMEHRLKTKEGRAIYARRKSTSEPVFGIIKAVMGFRHFMLRGVKLVSGEWNLVCIAWNLKRLHILAA